MPALREIFASFGVKFDDRELKQGAKQVSAVTDKLRGLGQMLAAGLVVQQVGSFIQSTIQTGTELRTLSQRLRISTTDLQRWQHAAEMSGASSDDITEALSELQVKAYEAAVEGSEMREHFQRLGVTLTDDQGRILDTNRLMENFIDGLSRTTDASIQLGAADAIMSEEGKRLLPFFRQGREAVDRYRAELDALGGGASERFVERANELGISVASFRTALMSLRSTLSLNVLPVVTRGVEALTRWSARLSQMPGTVRMLTLGMGALGAAAVLAAAKSAAAWIAAAWPILAAAAAVAILYLAVDDLWTTWNGGDSILRQFINELFPGMVGGLDATDRAILSVTGAVATLITMLESLGAVAAGVGDIILAPLRPALALLGMVQDLSSGVGIGRSLSRAAGRMTASFVTGESLLDENPERQDMAQRRRGLAEGTETIWDRIRGERRGRREEYLRESMLPEHLRRVGLGNLRQANETNVDARQEISIAINADGIQDPREVMAIARREMRAELDRHARQTRAALVPQSSEWDWESEVL